MHLFEGWPGVMGCPHMQQVARVDLGSALNGAAREVAYTRLERLLAHLEALTGLAPACAAQHAAIYRHGRIVISSIPCRPVHACVPALPHACAHPQQAPASPALVIHFHVPEMCCCAQLTRAEDRMQPVALEGSRLSWVSTIEGVIPVLACAARATRASTRRTWRRWRPP